jgi:hypothetical protein
MQSQDWSELLPTMWNYFRKRLQWTGRTALGELIKEVVVVTGGCFAGLIGALAQGQSVWWSLIWALGGGFAALVAIIVFFFLISPSQIYKHQEQTIRSMTARGNFVGPLIERQKAMLTIQADKVFEAKFELHTQQELVIQLLYRNENPWRFAPHGWGEHFCDQPFLQWGGLYAVMEYRYRGEIVPMQNLFKDGKLKEEHFNLLRTSSSDCVGLIIREIRFPGSSWVANRNIEPDEYYLQAINSFRPLASDTLFSQLPEASP